MAFGILLFASPAMAEPATVQAYMAQPQVQPDARIAYGAAPAQVVELFLPRGGARPYPVVVMLHGGCYLAEYQGLTQTSGIAADLAARGYAVWNVEYRKLGEDGAGFPGTYLDVADAVDRIRAEAPKYGLDPDRVVAVGHSAGGHLALWAASRAKLPRDSQLWRADPLKIRAVVSLGGIGDLKPHAGVFAGACGPSIAQVAPPATYPETSPAALLPTGVAATMIHGEFDHVMPPDTGQAYAATVRAAGDPAEAIEIKGVGHFDPVMPGTEAWKTVVVPAIARAFGKAR
ncbi:MAG: alpha/beta hydrolase [Phenylobacterium zucineum]|nr:MAG: alpha/beta hydrolase [Phenylobacterium zucineum]